MILDQAIIDYPYLWRFVKDQKISAKHLEENSEINIFSCTEIFDNDYVGQIIDLDDALLELRVVKGKIEDHVSLIWVEEKKQNQHGHSNILLELLSAMNRINSLFSIKDIFSFFRIEYLEVLHDIKNKRNNLISFCNTHSALSPPTHCGMWLLGNMDSKTSDGKLNRLKVYNAILSNSKVFIFKTSEVSNTGELNYKFGVIEDDTFSIIENKIEKERKGIGGSVKLL